jgi:hypothetical protein
MRRSVDDEIDSLIKKLQFVNSLPYILPGRLPKVSSEIEVRILDKIFKLPKLSVFKDGKGSPFYYRAAGGRYWNVVTNYTTHTSAEKSIVVKYHNLIGASLSSSLFWFYQQVYTDGLNLKVFDIENFPVPNFEVLSNLEMSKLEGLYTKYLSDIELNANIRTTGNDSSYNVDQFKEYKIGYSKKIIDEIDDFIGPLYGLTTEEIEFVKNYEIEFRMADYWTADQMEEFISKRADFSAGDGAGAAPGGAGAENRRTGCAWQDQPGGTRRRVLTKASNDEDEELE